MPYTVLVVDADPNALSQMSRALAGVGYVVTDASSFTEARQRVVRAKPDVLITAVRLVGYNGLDLVRRSHASLPGLVTIVTHVVPDPVLQARAADYDATYLVKPVDSYVLLGTLGRLMFARAPRPRTTTPRRWARKRPAHRVGAAYGAAHGIIIDLSYGGLGLHLTEEAGGTSRLPQRVTLPALGLGIRARTVWTCGGGPKGPWWCGIEFEEPEPNIKRAWREFVDVMRTGLS